MVTTDNDGLLYEDLSVFDRLVTLISKMTDQEQQTLLQALEKRTPKRKEERKAVFMDVTFTINTESYSGIAQDLSRGGAFVEAKHDFAIGQEITLDIPFSDSSKSVKVKGRIARVEPNGFGVQFYR